MKEKLTVVLLMLSLCATSQTAFPYNIVIDEIMADPSPVLGLPNTEFIELRNVSSQAFNLNGWRMGDAGGSASIGINFILQPDSFVVLCANTAVSMLAGFGTTIGLSNFPSLDNEGDQLYIRSKEGRIIHAVTYTAEWYQNPVKSQGGWTLEMIDPKNPCSGYGNWTASNDLKGGTPGRINSADGSNKDLEPPVLLGAFVADSTSVIIRFDEPLDSTKAAVAGNYTISDGIGAPQSVITVEPDFSKVQLKTARMLAKNKIYTITVTNTPDCSGNAVGAYNTVKLGLASPAHAGDLVINETLFNPLSDGADYIELYNRGNSVIDLKDCYIANRPGGNIASLKQISAGNRLLFPGEFVVITEDATAVKKQYLAKNPGAFAVVNAMPSFPDDTGDIVIISGTGEIIDELNYDEHWQFKLIENKDGVALERIDYNKPTQDASNWHSAATSAGYGTPGYQNSQFRTDLPLQEGMMATPLVFSPDNDGFNDFLTLSYRFPEQGYVCNITIFDAGGRPIRYLTRNALCGLQGVFRWDGLDENSAKLPIGVYVIFTEVFNLKGKTSRFKQAVTLARSLR